MILASEVHSTGSRGVYLEGVTTRPKLDQKELEDVDHESPLV
jgi:hypothetical protein